MSIFSKEKVHLTVIILTCNEAPNIQFAISNVRDWTENIYILDSGSEDVTCALAERLGAQIFFRNFDNYANQRNYAIKELPIPTEWVLFLDADEYLTEELKAEIAEVLINGTEYDGFYLKRRFYFMGKWIRFGGYYPTWILRLFKKDLAICERSINEHITVSGKVGYLKNDFVDHNRKDFSHWLEKHNKYASLEATQFEQESHASASFWGSPPERKQWIRQNIWNKLLPPLVRPFIYFFYRYFFRLGFLDGKIGFIYHFMHGLVYPFIIDVKYLERKLKK